MLRSMTLQQFREWQLFAEIEPFDEERDDLRFGSVVQMIAEVNRNPKRRARPFKLDEARLRFGDSPAPKRQEQTWQQQKMLGYQMAMSFGAVIEKAPAPSEDVKVAG